MDFFTHLLFITTYYIIQWRGSPYQSYIPIIRNRNVMQNSGNLLVNKGHVL